MAEELDQAASEAEAVSTFEDVLARVIAERDAGDDAAGAEDIAPEDTAPEDGDRGDDSSQHVILRDEDLMSSHGPKGAQNTLPEAEGSPAASEASAAASEPQPEAPASEAPAPTDAPATAPTDTAIAPLDPRATLHHTQSAPAPAALELDDSAAAAFEALERQRAVKRRKKFIRIGIVVAIALVAAGVWWFLTHNSAQEAEEEFVPETAFVYRGDFTTEVSASGSLKPYSSVVVTPEVEGTVETIAITQDQAVAAGDVLFTIKNDELDRAVQAASQAVRQAQTEVANANNALSNAYWQLDAARAAYAANPEMVYDENEYNAAIESARQAVESANMTLENANTSYNDAVDTANKRTVRATATGTIIAMDLQVGQAVGPSSQGLMQIADLSQMRVGVQVNEIDIETISEGQRALATFSAVSDLTLEGKVVRIASVATGMENDVDSFGGGGIANFGVEIVFSQPDPRLKPGMTASIRILTQDVPDALLVPAGAVYDAGDGTWYADVVVDPETYETETVQVTVGEQNQSSVVITDGLSEGDEIVVGGGASASSFDFGEDGGVMVMDEATASIG